MELASLGVRTLAAEGPSVEAAPAKTVVARLAQHPSVVWVVVGLRLQSLELASVFP